THELREHAAAPGPRGPAPGARREPRALAQHRRPAHDLRHRDPRAMTLWLDTLHPTRFQMLTVGPTEREQKIVGAHFAYWKDLAAKGTALLVGRTQDAGAQTVGIAVFEAVDGGAATARCQARPSVLAGVLTGTVERHRLAATA